MLINLLLFRFAILNLLIIAAIGVLTWQGEILPIFLEDQTGVTYAIAGLFLISWCWTAREIITASADRNDFDRGSYRVAASKYERDKDLSKVAWLTVDMPSVLVFLGLIGTALGMKLGMQAVSADSATEVQSSIGSFLRQFALAIDCNILGCALALWQVFNARMLTTALESYWADRLIVSERRG